MKARNGWQHLAQSLRIKALLMISPADVCMRLPSEISRLCCDNSALSDSDTSAERWLRPGTEYAIGEKLLLPKHWYQDIHLNTDGMDPLEGQLLAIPWRSTAQTC